MSTAVTQIKERLSIDEVIGTYIKLERSGVNFKARCPFHNEKTPSFFISPARGGYYCFGCGVKGDIFSFVESYEGLDFRGALKVLADRAGVIVTNERPGEKDERERLFQVMELACQFFESQREKNKTVVDYITTRGVSLDTIKLFRVGYAVDSWRTLTDYLQSKGFSLIEIEKAGLAKTVDGRTYDRFRDRIMFPISDSSGRVVAFSGRIVTETADTAKYLNSPDTVLFDKSSTLYGLDKAKEAIRRVGYAILVEGQFDLVLAHQAGTKNVVAASGTALSDEGEVSNRGVSNMTMLKRLAKNVVLAFDGDTAGINATYRGARIAFSLGMDVKVAVLPQGKDPADIVREGSTAWKNVLSATVPAIAFFVAHKRTQAKGDETKFLKEGIPEILKLIKSLPSATIREHELLLLEKETGKSLESLKVDLENTPDDTVLRVAVTTIQGERENTLLRASDRLFGLLLWQASLKAPTLIVDEWERRIIEIVGEDAFRNLKDYALMKGDVLIFEAEAAYFGSARITEEAELLLSLLEEEHLTKELTKLSAEIRKKEHGGETTATDLLTLHREKAQRLESIKRDRHKNNTVI